MPKAIINDMQLFMDSLKMDTALDLKNLGIKQKAAEVINRLTKIYELT